MDAPRLVVGAVLTDDLDAPRCALAARRVAPPALAGRWELPGGKVEPGETPEQALHRELAEELGLRVVLGAELRPVDGPGWPLTPGLVLRVWWARALETVPTAGPDHDALRWCTADDVTTLDWLEPDRPIAERIKQQLASTRGSAAV